jgi:hypothetical protein
MIIAEKIQVVVVGVGRLSFGYAQSIRFGTVLQELISVENTVQLDNTRFDFGLSIIVTGIDAHNNTMIMVQEKRLVS